ncbi:hypothetical protein [Rhizobium leguminosarum]|uniref:hypothetical protein n=1 Tax=Rhizobium leguminosarum TaxID=384 RepID=UPI00140FDD6B|nr:hypothetical protein [Rhizobium leguminosarum]QIO68211.1 hypothetical protein HA462_25300 [Rhizobium leguminosarum bv. trifolii]
MKWLLDKIVSVIATRMATREIAALLSDIRSAGGSDVVCSKALAEIDGTPDLRKFVETSGIRNSLISIEASVLGVAAGNSIMLARRDLQTATDSAEVLQRLQMAQRAFVYSSLIFSDEDFEAEMEKQAQRVLQLLAGNSDTPTLYDERKLAAEAALEKWMMADLTKYAFI